MKKLPSLRTGICTIGQLRFPAIVGKVEGETREIFICGVHLDRFIGTLPPPELWQLLQQGIEVRADGAEL
jgi:hypothetical protein